MYAKKEIGKNAKAGNPEVIWVLCLRHGLEAERNSSCVFPKFLALGLVLDLGSMTSSSPAYCQCLLFMDIKLVVGLRLLLLFMTFPCFSQI